MSDKKIVSEKRADVNRTVDGDVAEGHIRQTLENAGDPGKTKKVFGLDDAETEGHLIIRQKR